MKFFVPGQVVAKGSTHAFLHSKTNKVITRQGNASKLYPWQQTIGFFARQAGVALTERGVIVRMRFFLKRPKQPSNPYPSRPDADKLVRSCLDALTGIAYHDDSQVVKIEASKEYASDQGTGVEIEVL